MLQFLKYVFATIVGLFLFACLALLLVIGIVSTAASDKSKPVADNSVLKITFDKPIVERANTDDPLADLNMPFIENNSGIGLIELKQAIKHAKTNDKVKGIYLDLALVRGGHASIEEIRNALIDFKKTNKFVYAYSEIYSEEAYYLASVADNIFMPPVGLIEFNGMDSEIPFIKGTLDKLEIKPEIFKVGEFKSAVEPFFLDKMSDANRAQVTSYLNSMNDHILSNVSKARNIPLDQITLISDSMKVREANDALKYKLITNLGYFDEVEASLRKKLGIEKETEKIKYVSLNQYIKAEETSVEKSTSKDRIAVIVANGEIESGKGDVNTIGSDRIAEAIRKARSDDKIKAVVLRINSPGGSALASDVMWREVQLTSKVKPIIASMSDVAASGGYYMAMGCDTIVAQPNTITGSIGVFGVLFNAQSFLNNKIGVTTDVVKTGEFSDLGKPTRPVSPYERLIIQSEVEKIYDDFTKKAAEGRGMTQDQIKQIASGRVWSGIEAKNNGLVDVLGGLDDAIALAAKAAKLDDYKVRYYPEQKSVIEQFLQGMNSDTESVILKRQLGEYYKYVKVAKEIQKWEGVQARLPYDVTQ